MTGVSTSRQRAFSRLVMQVAKGHGLPGRNARRLRRLARRYELAAEGETEPGVATVYVRHALLLRDLADSLDREVRS